MNRLTLVILAITCLPQVVPAQRPDPGKLYESESGRFRVKFPSKPRLDTKDLATGKSGISPVTVVTERAETRQDVVLAVVYADYPDEFKHVPAQKILDGVRDGLKGKDGRVVSDAEVQFADPTQTSYRQIRIEAGRNVIRVRLYLVGSRLYQVLVIGDTRHVSSAECEEFFNTFEIIKDRPLE